MRLFRPLSLLPLLSLVACEPRLPDSAPSSARADAIINGTPIPPATTRAVMLSDGISICSGTLLSSTWVLTARHCVTSDRTISGPLKSASSITVSLGSATAVGAAIVQHPSSGTSLDVALLQLAKPITSAVPVQLYAGPSLVGSVVRCMGYGDNSPSGGGTGSGTLRTADFKVVSSAGNTFTIEQNADAAIPWHGDSGGPCFAVDGGGVAVRVAGVMSGFLDGSAQTKLLAVRTDSFDKQFAPVAFGADSMVGDANTQLVSFTGADKGVEFTFANVDGKHGLDYVYFGDTTVVVSKATASGFYEAAKEETKLTPGTGWNAAAAAADMNGDGLADYVHTGATQLWVAVGKGDGFFKTPVGFSLGGTGGWSKDAFIMDVDGVNGADYVQLRGGELWVSRSSGGATPTFPAATKVATVPSTWDWASTWIGNVNGAGGGDLAFMDSTSVSVVLSNASGGFGGVVTTPMMSQTGWSPFARLAQVSPDNKADWVAIRNSVLYSQLSVSGGAFSPVMTPSPIEWGEKWDETGHWADMNGDGLTDFVSYDGTHLWVKLANGAGAFTRIMGQNIVAPSPYTVRFVDANGDKKADVVFVSDQGSEVMIVTHLSSLSSSVKAPLEEVPDPDPIDLSSIVYFMTSLKLWGIETPLQRLCARVNCYAFSMSSAAGDGGKASGLLATLHGGLQGQRVKSLLPEDARANGWDWTRAQEVLVAGDVDGDGRDEVVLRDARGLAVLGREAQTDAPRVLTAQAWDSQAGEWPLRADDTLVHAGDYDGQPGAELLVRSVKGAVGLLRVSGAGVLESLAVYPEGSELGQGPLTPEASLEGLGDHDGDGRRDVVLRGPEGWTFLRGMEKGLEPWGFRVYGEWLVEDALTPESQVVATGHFSDSQGPMELLVRGEAGLTLVRVEQGRLQPTGFFPWHSWGGSGPLRPEDAFQFAGDVDGDGRDELLVRTHEGIGVLAFNGGELSPLLTVWYGQDLEDWDMRPEDTFQAAGDLDGDGRQDLVVRREDRLGVLGSRAWDSRWLRWSLPLGASDDGRSVASVAPVSADLDGDGVRELLAHEVAR